MSSMFKCSLPEFKIQNVYIVYKIRNSLLRRNRVWRTNLSMPVANDMILLSNSFGQVWWIGVPLDKNILGICRAVVWGRIKIWV